ncbi:MAG: YdcF family protein [Clostridiales bacterium]|nr:YdcF family protein [Clostridiales bacterium]
MLVAIILGNRLNDDGSTSEILKNRLAATLKLNALFAPSKIIVSGGIANPNAGISEAEVMRNYLISQGLESDKIVVEDRSMTTKQNAEFSVPIAAKLGATEILLCTSTEHMGRKFLNPIRLFSKELQNFEGIKLRVYSE